MARRTITFGTNGIVESETGGGPVTSVNLSFSGVAAMPGFPVNTHAVTGTNPVQILASGTLNTAVGFPPADGVYFTFDQVNTLGFVVVGGAGTTFTTGTLAAAVYAI